ncbi:MAG: CBS domain-containing protein [Desulfovibrio sp.]
MLKVKDLMTKDLEYLYDTHSLHDARTLMDQKRIRHIPIVTQQQLFTGLITQRDILSATVSRLAELDKETQVEIDQGIPIREIMRTDLLTAHPEDNLRSAAKTLLSHKYGCLPVVDKGELVGIVTEADFMRLTIALMDSYDSEALDIKTFRPESV